VQPLDPHDPETIKKNGVEVNPESQTDMERHGLIYTPHISATEPRREPFLKWDIPHDAKAIQSPGFPEDSAKLGPDRVGIVLFGKIKSRDKIKAFKQLLAEKGPGMVESGHHFSVYLNDGTGIFSLHPWLPMKSMKPYTHEAIDHHWLGQKPRRLR